MAGTNIIPNQPQTPNAAPPTPAPAPSPAPAPPQATASAPPPNRDAIFGRAAKQLLMGSSTNYQIDPQTGQTVATQTPNKPGTFFRNVLNAALLGGAAAESAHAQNPQMGFAGGLVTGGGADVQDQRKQDLLKRSQAQQQFENQQSAAKEQRDQQAFDTEQQVRKAQIAQANAETYRTNVLTQGATLDQHKQVADMGKQHFSDYDKAGLQPVLKDVTETDMQQTLKNRPGASTLDWEATGVKMGTGPDGKPTFEYTYSAYDPKGKIPVSKGTLDQWKADGMDKYYPELFTAVTAGKELDASQYIELKKTDERLFNDGLDRQKAEQGTAESEAKVHEANARAAASIAEAHKYNADAAEEAVGKKQSEQFGLALQDLDKSGGDFTKIKPSSRLVIAESANKMAATLGAQYKQVLSDPEDPDAQQKAQELYGQIHQLNSLGTQAIGSMLPKAPTTGPNPNAPPPLVQKALDAVKNMDPEDARAAIQSATSLTPDQKKAALDQYNQGQKQAAADTRGTVKGAVKQVVESLIP